MERRHEDDIRKLWIRIAILTVIMGVATGSGRMLEWILNIMEIIGL